MKCSLNVSLRPSEIELTAKLDPVHRRLLARLRSWNSRGDYSGTTFTSHLLIDPEVGPEAVVDAIADLYTIGIFRMSTPGADFAIVIRELAIAVAEVQSQHSIAEAKGSSAP